MAGSFPTAAADTSLSFSTMIHMITIKLTSKNYLLWKSQIVPLLSCQNLFGFLDGSIPKPSPTIIVAESPSPNPAFSQWISQDQRLLSLLLSSLTEEAMTEVLGCTTSRQVWLSLEAAFSHNSKQRELRLKDDLQLMKKGTRSISEFARDFKSLCDQLAAIGRPIDDTDKSHWFLRGLGPTFSSFSAAHMAISPLPSFSDLIPKAESFEIFQQSLDIVTPPSAAFLATMGNTPHRSGPSHQSFRDRGRGNGRGGGHGRNGGRSYTPCCQICKIEGHTADRCRKRYDRASSEDSAHLAEAFNASCSLSSNEVSDWYVDTGASAHMTPASSTLDSSTPYKEQVDRGFASNRSS